MKQRLILLLLLLVGGNCLAQFYSSKNTKAIALYEKGVAAMQRSETANALKFFTQALKADPEFGEVYLVLGEHYLKQDDYENAKANYETFLHSKCKNKAWQNDARRGLDIIAFRQRAIANPVPFEPKNLGPAVNTPDDEYLPSMTVDAQTLVFTRRVPRRTTTVAGLREEEDLFSSTLQEGRWTKATRMAEPLNSNDNEGAQAMSQDGRIIFFTAYGREDSRGRCDIYMCTNKGNVWSRPRNLGSPVNTNAWESQPSFSIDGKTLYFVSDRAGGYGGKDIWKTVFENGKWSEPENLGPEVNTPYDEMSPFISFNNRDLYFASNGHLGMGGMDIFITSRTNAGWSTPRNLGYPINTAADESGLIVSPNGGTAIYSSDRLGGYGRQDLYQFQLPIEFASGGVCHIKGYVYDKKSNQRLKSNIQIIDVATGEEVAVVGSDVKDGTYMVSLPPMRDYAFHVSANGYLFYSENFDYQQGVQADSNGVLMVDHFVRNIALSPIEVGESIVLNNIFFETGKYELVNSEVELAKVVDILAKNPTLKVELAGHTDNVGRPADNKALSERRAKAVYDYLIAHGISSTRLSYQGYGDTKPIADNATQEGRASNRRTTFTILEK